MNSRVEVVNRQLEGNYMGVLTGQMVGELN